MTDELKKTHFMKLMPHNIDQLKNVRSEYKPVFSVPFTDNEIVSLGIREFKKLHSQKLQELKPKEPAKKGGKKNNGK